MRDRLMRIVRGEQCRLDVGRTLVVARRESGAQKRSAATAHRSMADCLDLASDELRASISAVLGDIGCRGLPVRALLDDDVVRYFMVTPPSNAASMSDLRSAADVRFEGLYGEPVAPWHVMADWQGGVPFLACAAPRHVIDALRLAVAPRRTTLVSVTPNFVAAWNRLRHDVSADAWLATLSGVTLTLGIVVGASRPRLAAVRTLVFKDDRHSVGRLCEQVAYAAMLEGVPLAASLHVRGLPPEALPSQSVPGQESAMVVHWHRADDATSDKSELDAGLIDKMVQREAAT